jgi:hypothetical protein
MEYNDINNTATPLYNHSGNPYTYFASREAERNSKQNENKKRTFTERARPVGAAHECGPAAFGAVPATINHHTGAARRYHSDVMMT